MIYTVTLNPSYDYTVSVSDFMIGGTNRCGSETLTPGGKGINVSVVLGNLGYDSTLLGFAAGFTGEALLSELECRGIHCDFVRVKNGFSRINIKLNTAGTEVIDNVGTEGASNVGTEEKSTVMSGSRAIRCTEINGRGPNITQEEINLMLNKLRNIRRDDILVLAGSIPPSLPDDMYGIILDNLSRDMPVTVVDASGSLLLNTLKYRPFLVKPNAFELGGLFDTDITDRRTAAVYGRRLTELGARNVLVSLAGDGAVLISEDGDVYEAAAPKGEFVNGVGAGDSMVAGFLAGWLEKRDYKYAFYMGLAAGSASAYTEGLAGGEEIREMFLRCIEGV